MEHVLGGAIAAHQKIILAQKTAKQDFASGHIKNPYTHCPVLRNAYDRAAMRLILGEQV